MGEALRHEFVEAARALRSAGIATPELDARLLLCHATGLTHEACVSAPDAILSGEAGTRLDAMLMRRLAGEPVSRIIGAREFYGREFAVDEHTLDPRADTEILIDAVLESVRREGGTEAPLRVLDLGTGTGCILLTLLVELPRAIGVGSDLSAAALKIAKRNAAAFGVVEQVSFVLGDWLDPIEGDFDIVVCNPPYIASAEIKSLPREVGHDPRLALDGGADGLEAYRRILAGVRRCLRPEGMLFLEIGAGQEKAVFGLLVEAGFPEARVWNDLAGRPRSIGVRLA